MKSRNIILLFSLFILVHSIQTGNGQNSDSLRRVIQTSKGSVLVDNCIALANVYKYNNFDSAIYYVTWAEREAEKINYSVGYSEAIFCRGNVLYFNNDYSEAISYFKKSLDNAEERGDSLLKARCLERLASVHLMTDDPNLALKLYFESLIIFEKLNYQKGIAKIYNILGIYKADMGEFDLALSYLDKSIQINQEMNDLHNLIENKVNMGYVYEQSGDLDKAEKIYLETIPLILQIGDLSAMEVVYFNLSSLHQSRNDNQEGLKFIQKAAEIAEELNDTSMLASLYGNAGELLMKEKKWIQAKGFLNKSIICSQSTKDIETEIHALNLLANIDSINGDLNSALFIRNRVSILKDTLYRYRLKHSLQESELRYENLKHQELIALQERIIRTDKMKKTLFITLFFITSAVLVLLLGLFIVQRKSHTKGKKLFQQQINLKQLELEQVQQKEKLQKLEKEKIEESLKLKERELVSLALQMERSKENFTFFRDKIKHLSESHKINVEELITLEKELKSRCYDYDSWDLFYKSFNEIHKDFFTSLKASHPDLTNSELKYCAYIRIHLSANQMSTLLNVSIEAIRKTRYRIRKKMKLAPRESLYDYLLNF